MERYNIYLNLNYKENAERIKAELEKREGFLNGVRDYINYERYVRQKLRDIEEILFNDKYTARILDHCGTRILFQNFLCVKSPKTKPDAYYLLRCLDMCNSTLRQLNSEFLTDYIFEFLEACPTYYWEQKIEKIFEMGQLTPQAKTVVGELRNACILNLAADQDHNDFIKQVMEKSKLLKKLLILTYEEHKRVLMN